MKTYPIRIPRHSYRGSNAAKTRKSNEYNRIAALVESYLNADLASKENDTIQQYFCDSVASKLIEDRKTVRAVINSIDGGSNGVTIVKGNLERAMASQAK